MQAVDHLEVGQPSLMARPGGVVDTDQLQRPADLRDALLRVLCARSHPQPNLGFVVLRQLRGERPVGKRLGLVVTGRPVEPLNGVGDE
jgi:hypothetical protein